MNFKSKQLEPFGVLLEPTYFNQSIHSLDVENLREIFHAKQFIVLRGFKTFMNADDFALYCENWGKISLWPYGKVLELIEQENPTDHIFHHNYVPLHWDGMYREQIPEYQIFHCVSAPLQHQGGRTTFSNTFLTFQNATQDFISLCNKVTGIYLRKTEFYHSKVISPIITKHPYKNYNVIRYNEIPANDFGHFINYPELKFEGLKKEIADNFHHSLKKALYSKNNFYAHAWEKNDIVIADNLTLLHGREAFLAKSPRHLQRVHVLSDPPVQNENLESYK
ncbi:TauD/TfdA family dioxygenase [Pigmentibacter sp. JX0631]|uniref:TauD/TfdA family dioxygenase n=1 Tax=Pigmentibacter sp. JX0631 TaxID=2976982 RepID=UPI002469C0DB|nr:TauD/TfdA family dioxygenase [Pigmentibacter sp. JX0631]WGL59738.1 TauD/TfdA family dioxygenase [Pigmentibacter sp. JX0631]